MTKKSDFPYLHGFSQDEQDRLKKQARFAEQSVYSDVDLSGVKNLIEVGCGVGAQSEIIMRRFPDLQLTGIDLNTKQLATANQYLNSLTHLKGRYNLKEMNATKMDFSSGQFDGAFLCWVLEHVPDPQRVLSEVRRVIRPGAIIYVTEVMNSSFFLEPYSPNIWKYWMAFNDYQYDNAGDPFIGAKLGNMLSAIGFVNIETKIKTWHLDNRQPVKRKEVIDYWNELLLSARDQLVKAEYIDEETADLAKEEMENVSNDPNAVFLYSFMQAQARNGF